MNPKLAQAAALIADVLIEAARAERPDIGNRELWELIGDYFSTKKESVLSGKLLDQISDEVDRKLLLADEQAQEEAEVAERKAYGRAESYKTYLTD